IDVRDAIGRLWQLGTIQLDFNHPERFDLEYIGPDNARHRPIMVHRPLFGSVARFFGVLVQPFAGARPPCLAPLAVRALPGSEGEPRTSNQRPPLRPMRARRAGPSSPAAGRTPRPTSCGGERPASPS